MSFLALQCYDNVIYNELDSGVVAVLRDLQQCGFSDKYYQWISRDKFHAHKNDGDWFGGLCSVAWSFGNNGSDYLFGSDVEPAKKLAHLFVVFDDQDARQKLSDLLGVEIPKQLCGNSLFGISIKEKRIALCHLIKRTMRFDLEQLERLQQLERLERLQQFERLEQLERLQQLLGLEISNKSYADVSIKTPKKTTVIYLDPPYANTGTYSEKLCHNDLQEWILSSKYDVYMSSYECDYMECIAEFEHTCSMSATKNNAVTERLYFRAGDCGVR